MVTSFLPTLIVTSCAIGALLRRARLPVAIDRLERDEPERAARGPAVDLHHTGQAALDPGRRHAILLVLGLGAAGHLWLGRSAGVELLGRGGHARRSALAE